MLCPVTSDVRTAAFRVTIEPDAANRLTTLAQVMVDKISTVSRSKVSEPFGQISDERVRAIDRALLLVVGLS
jgi:mRNA interferase MazF